MIYIIFLFHFTMFMEMSYIAYLYLRDFFIVGVIVIYCGDNKIIMYEYSKYNTIYISIIRIILD